jgi:hypothetical protein
VTNPDRLLEWFGEERCRQHLRRARRFWAGEDRIMVSVTTPRHRPRQDATDEERFASVLAGLEAQARLPGLNLPSIFPDYGTITTARYWGGKERVAAETGNPFIEPVAASVEEALTLRPLPVDDPRMDAARALRLYRRVREALGTEQLWFRTPDMQGPLNTAGLILKQDELLMAMHAEAGNVHRLLDGVCSFLIELWRYLRRESAGRLCGSIWPYTFLPPNLGVSFTEDLMPLLSAEAYEGFGIPRLRAIAAAFGGLHIHCCGPWGRHARALKASGLNILAMEFHHPFTRLEEIESLAGTTVFIPYIMLDRQERFRTVAEFYSWLVRETDSRFRFWFACADDSPEMIEFARQFGR